MMQLIRNFTFTDADYDLLAFSDSSQISLDFKNHYAFLRKQSDEYYDIESEVTDARWVRSAISAPSKCRKLKLLQSLISLPTGTIDGYLLGDGTNAYRWNGAAWVTTDPDLKTGWNTEAEINEGIESFPYFTNYCVYVRLGTNDKTLTPLLTEIAVLYEVDVFSWDESMLQRTLVRKIAEVVELITDVAYVKPASGTTISFSDVVAKVKENINFKEPIQVFNLTDDPNLLTDLFSSYNPTTKVITLTASVAADKRMFIRASCSIPVQLEAQSPDYIEVEQCPSITLSEDDERTFHNYPNRPFIVDKANKLSYEATYSKRLELQLNLTIVAGTKFDLYRLRDSVSKFVEANRILLNSEIDREMSITQTSGFRNTTSANLTGFFTSMTVLFIIFNVTSGNVTTKPIITSMNLTLEG